MRDVFIHPSSFVEDSEIGDGTKIWHFCHVHGARIGKDCVIGQGCYIAPGVVIGDRCKIENNVSVFTGVTLEDNVFVGPSVVFTNVVNPRARIARKGEYQKTLVKTGASIGANSTVIGGVTIGGYAAIGAGSVVTKDVRSMMLVLGNPAKEIRPTNEEWTL